MEQQKANVFVKVTQLNIASSKRNLPHYSLYMAKTVISVIVGPMKRHVSLYTHRDHCSFVQLGLYNTQLFRLVCFCRFIMLFVVIFKGSNTFSFSLILAHYSLFRLSVSSYQPKYNYVHAW